MMTACEAHRTLLYDQRGEALPKPGQMGRLQVSVERRPAVIDLIEEDVVRRPFHLHNIELSAARLVGKRMAGIVLRQSEEGLKTVGFDHELRDDHEGGRLSELGHDRGPSRLTPPWQLVGRRPAPSRAA